MFQTLTVRQQTLTALSVILVQIAIILVSGGIAIGVSNVTAAMSVISGGAVSLVTSVLFGLRVFGGNQDYETGKFLRRLYSAEAQKLVITFLALIALFHWTNLRVELILLGFVLATLAYWVVWPVLHHIEAFIVKKTQR